MTLDFYAGLVTGLLSVGMAIWLFVALFGLPLVRSLVLAAIDPILIEEATDVPPLGPRS